MHIKIDKQFNEKNPINLKDFLVHLERDILIGALRECFFINTHAARLLGIRRTTLIEKMRRHGLKLNKQSSKKQEKNNPNADSRIRR